MAALALTALDVGLADADVRYAEPLGNGPEPCLQANPCEIEHAIEGTAPTDVDAGDEIVVLPGTYSNLFELQVSKAINVHGTGFPAPRILTGDATGISVNNAGATVSDLSVLHSNGSFSLQMNAGTVERVSVRTIGAGAAVACFVGGGTLRDSLCVNDRTTAGSDALAYTISGVTTRSSVLRNVTAVSTAPASFGARYASDAGATVSVDAKNVILSGVAGDLRAQASVGSTLTLALDHSNFADVVLAGTGTPSVTPSSTSGNQTAPPQFVNAAGADYRQVASSPTVDAGTGDPALGATDPEGDLRTLGAAPDIGADELVPAPVGPDQTAPDTTITKAPKRKSAKRKARLAFNSNEPGSTFECRFDEQGFAPCVSPLKRKLKRGKHRFEVRAIDAAGNVDLEPARARWKVKRRK